MLFFKNNGNTSANEIVNNASGKFKKGIESKKQGTIKEFGLIVDMLLTRVSCIIFSYFSSLHSL